MKRRIVLPALTCLFIAATAHAQHGTEEEPSQRRIFVGSTLMMIGDLLDRDHPPMFFQLNGGYRLTPNDTLSLEAITWRYYHPLGIQYWSGPESPDHAYPGHVREYGLGVAYQRFLWKGLYSSFSAVPLFKQYFDSNNRKIQDGFQLFMALRLGYHLCLMNRVFIEPSIAVTSWLSTNAPQAFAAQDKRWPAVFLFEPGLHFGVEL